MADKAHSLTDEKLEEMEKRLSAIVVAIIEALAARDRSRAKL